MNSQDMAIDNIHSFDLSAFQEYSSQPTLQHAVSQEWMTTPPVHRGQHLAWKVEQEPLQARVGAYSIEPPPALKLEGADDVLLGPYFVTAILVDGKEDISAPGGSLQGSTVSGLHRTKDSAYFVFGDLSVNTPGKFRLKFVLYKRSDDEAIWLGEIMSFPFEAYKHLACLRTIEQSDLTAWLINQGIRLRKRPLKSKPRPTVKYPLNMASYREEGELCYGPLAPKILVEPVSASEAGRIQFLKGEIQRLKDELDRIKSSDRSQKGRVHKPEGRNGHGRFRKTGWTSSC